MQNQHHLQVSRRRRDAIRKSMICRSSALFCSLLVYFSFELSCSAVEIDSVSSDFEHSSSSNDLYFAVKKELALKRRWSALNRTIEPSIEENAVDQQTGNSLSNFGQSFERHPCRRVCQQDQTLTCYYKLVVHNYQRVGAECSRCLYVDKSCAAERCIYGDGVPSAVMAVNGRVPGPPIEVCKDDTLIVDVFNQLSEATTIHWHGLSMSDSPEMDGVPFVTQYPIQPAEAFRYTFRADRSGTVWYHSHQGWQRGLGVAGSLVIRQQRSFNRHASLYDYDLSEHTLMIGDIVYHYDFSAPANILINGKGRNHLDSSLPDTDPQFRYERLRVVPGFRYRMRVINNGIFNCPLEFSVEQHRLVIISADGNDVEPMWADSFFIASAERFDFVLEANQYADNYWIRVRGYNNCSAAGLYQGAVLHYRGAARNELPFKVMAAAHYGQSKQSGKAALVVNGLDEFHSNGGESMSNKTTDVPTVALRSLQQLPWPRNTKFLTYYSSFGVRRDRDGAVNFQIDDITYGTPGVALLQARHLYDEASIFCNRSSLLDAGADCVRDNCECTNVLRLPAYEAIELVVVNYMNTTHPFHAHGYTFRLVGQGVIGSATDLRKIQELDKRGRLQRTPSDYPAVEKDTIQVPGLGYIIVRFISDNPGFWLYHCHIELHAISGMVAVLKVGENHQMKSSKPSIRC